MADPMSQVRQVYVKLGLPGLEEAEPAMQKYLDQQAGYVKNRYIIDEATIHRVEKHWGFAIKRWGYEPPR